MAFTISLPARPICCVEIDAVQQQLASKKYKYKNIKCYGMIALRRGPVGMVSLIRVAAISSGDRGAAVRRRLRPRWKSGVTQCWTIC